MRPRKGLLCVAILLGMVILACADQSASSSSLLSKTSIDKMTKEVDEDFEEEYDTHTTSRREGREQDGGLVLTEVVQDFAERSHPRVHARARGGEYSPSHGKHKPSAARVKRAPTVGNQGTAVQDMGVVRVAHDDEVRETVHKGIASFSPSAKEEKDKVIGKSLRMSSDMMVSNGKVQGPAQDAGTAKVSKEGRNSSAQFRPLAQEVKRRAAPSVAGEQDSPGESHLTRDMGVAHSKNRAHNAHAPRAMPAKRIPVAKNIGSHQSEMDEKPSDGQESNVDDFVDMLRNFKDNKPEDDHESSKDSGEDAEEFVKELEHSDENISSTVDLAEPKSQAGEKVQGSGNKGNTNNRGTSQPPQDYVDIDFTERVRPKNKRMKAEPKEGFLWGDGM